MKLIVDRLGLILTAFAAAAIAMAAFHFVGENTFIVIFGILYIAQSMENSRLHKKLKELGHPDDLQSCIQARKDAQK
jgi:uncharacterized membrane protein